MGRRGFIWFAAALGLVFGAAAAGVGGALIWGCIFAALAAAVTGRRPTETGFEASPKSTATGSQADIEAKFGRIPGSMGLRDTHEGITYALTFLDQALWAGQLHEISYRLMRRELQQRLLELSAPAEAPAPVPERPAPTPAPIPARPESGEPKTTVPTPVAARPTTRVAAAPARTAAEPVPHHEPREPVWQQRLRTARELVASDFAIHGLAYLGVLLVFAGTLGFVVFSFGEVRIQLRPLAEAAIPAVLFGSAWFLRSRGAPFAAKGLAFLGGALLPVVIAASFVDGAPTPPDLEGSALVVVLATLAMVLAVAYAWWSLSNGDSPLRFLAAPLAWTSLFALGLGFGGESPTGGATLTAAQMSLTAVAVLATLAAARMAGDRPLARATEMAAIPGMIVAYALTLLFAWQEGWPWAPTLIAGLAALIGTELERDRLGTELSAIAELAVAAVTLVAATTALDTSVAGFYAVLTGIGLLEWFASRLHPSGVGVAGGAGIATLGLVATIPDAATAMVAWGLASVWAHARRLTSAGWAEMTDDFGEGLRTAAALAPAVAAAAAVIEFPQTAWPLVGLAVLAGAVLNRWPGGDDFYRWWLPACAWALLAGTAATHFASGEAGAGITVAAALGTIALGLGRDPAAVRVWTVSVSATWVSWLAFEAMGTSMSTRLLTWAIASLALVVTACMRRTEPWAEHLEAAGHIGSLLLLLAPAAGWGRIAALASWCGGWAATAVVTELGHGPAPVTRLLAAGAVQAGRERVEVAMRWLPPLLVTTSLPFVVLQAGYRSGLFRDNRPWAGLAMSLLALAFAAVTRVWPDRKEASTVLSLSGFILAPFAVGIAAPAEWPTIGATAAAIGVVALVDPALRRSFMVWCAWATTAPLALLLANQAGVGPDRLHIVLMVWGALLLLGGSAASRGLPAFASSLGSHAWIPVAGVGALVLPTGLALEFTRGPDVYGTSCLIVAVVYLATALLLRVGAISSVSWVLAVTGVGALLPVSPLEDPRLFVAFGAALLAAAWGLHRGVDDPWASWSLPPLIVAHGVAIFALARAETIGEVVVVWGGFAVLSVLTWAWRRRWEWALAADALALFAAASAGHGWFALALVCTSAVAVRIALNQRDPARLALSAAAALAAGGAWVHLLLTQDWPMTRWALATALACGVLAVFVATGIRSFNLDTSMWSPWAATAALGMAWACVPALEATSPRPLAAAALGLALCAVAVGSCARPLDIPGLREGAALIVVVSCFYLVKAFDLSDRQVVVASMTVGLAVVILSLAWRTSTTESPWLRPFFIVGAASVATSLFGAYALGDRGALSLALLFAGLEAASAAFVFGNHHLSQVAICIFCVAWLVFATGESVTASFYTVPIGVTLLACTEIERGFQRHAGKQTDDLILLEYSGMTILVAAPLIQTLTTSPWYGAPAVVLGAALVAWGGEAHVRRRVYFGAVTILLAAVFMLAGPVSEIVPHLTGSTLWIALAVAGVILLVAATSMERGRTRAKHALKHLNELMEGWE